eukprot:382654-Pelagomonas_calceolata.AAC.1
MTATSSTWGEPPVSSTWQVSDRGVGVSQRGTMLILSVTFQPSNASKRARGCQGIDTWSQQGFVSMQT